MYNVEAKGSKDSIFLETWVRPVGHYTVLETMPSLSLLKVCIMLDVFGRLWSIVMK